MEDSIVTVEMIEHYPSERQARERVEPDLRAWEVHAALTQYDGRREFSLDFDSAEVIDWNPPPRSTEPIVIKVGGTLKATGNISAHVIRSRYPTPPNQFILTPDAETMWHRYEGYLNDREPLAAMAYACLSLVEASAICDPRAKGRSKRKKAANLHEVDIEVFKKLGDFSSEQFGDNYTVRKFDADRKPRPHTPVERAWIEAAIRALILRVGQRAGDSNSQLPKLTMDSLPPLGH